MTTELKKSGSQDSEKVRMSKPALSSNQAEKQEKTLVASAIDELSINLANLTDPQLIQHTTDNVYRAAILELGGDELL